MKDIKPLSSKKPPVPESDHALIESWIAKAMPALQDILKDLDKRVRKELQQPVYAIKWGTHGTPAASVLSKRSSRHSANRIRLQREILGRWPGTNARHVNAHHYVGRSG